LPRDAWGAALVIDRLQLLYVTLFPASPPRFGAQRRLQGLMAGLARRNDVTAVSFLAPDLDAGEAEHAMRAYCREVVFIPSRPSTGKRRRLLQARSLLSLVSFERLFFTLPAAQHALDRLLRGRRYDIVNIEAPFLAPYRMAQAPPGERIPRLVLDQHNIEFDLVRQMAKTEHGFARRLYNSVDWPKIRREEMSAWHRFDGVSFTSALDERRARSLVPSVRSTVIPNAVDVEHFKPGGDDPSPDGCTVLFFGAINYYPNIDGVLFFLREVWPRLSSSHPRARLKIVGQHPTPEILAYRGPRVEVAGLVEDVRRHLAQAAVAIVPLRLGGGTRLKVVEAMAMARPVVSTSIGAEGIDITPERNILLADDPASFAAAVGRILDEPEVAARMGREGRALVEARYSWDAAAQRLEAFFRDILCNPRPSSSQALW
jgi:glycosyltransferase involved in cell wall biosynthesis